MEVPLGFVEVEDFHNARVAQIVQDANLAVDWERKRIRDWRCYRDAFIFPSLPEKARFTGNTLAREKSDNRDISIAERFFLR